MQTFSFRTSNGTLITTTDFQFFLALLRMHWEEKREAALKRASLKQTKQTHPKEVYQILKSIEGGK